MKDEYDNKSETVTSDLTKESTQKSDYERLVEWKEKRDKELMAIHGQKK